MKKSKIPEKDIDSFLRDSFSVMLSERRLDERSEALILDAIMSSARTGSEEFDMTNVFSRQKKGIWEAWLIEQCINAGYKGDAIQEKAKIIIAEGLKNPPPGFLVAYRRSLLGWYSRTRKVVTVKDLLKSVVDSGEEKLRKVFCMLIKNGDVHSVEMLLKNKGMDPNMVIDVDGNRPLMLASSYYNKGIVNALLANSKTDPYLCDRMSRNALHMAVHNGSEDAFIQIFNDDRVKNSFSLLNPAGFFAFKFVENEKMNKAVKCILDHVGKGINDTTRRGENILTITIAHKDRGGVKALLKSKDIDLNKHVLSNKSTGSFQTPLHIAAAVGDKKIMRHLLRDKRSNPDALNSNNETPLMLAKRMGTPEIVKVILKYGGAQDSGVLLQDVGMFSESSSFSEASSQASDISEEDEFSRESSEASEGSSEESSHEGEKRKDGPRWF
jgi:ankyrin repeat protein